MTEAASWAATRRRRASPSRIAAAVLLHLLVLAALLTAFDRIELRVRGERSTTLVSVAIAPPAPAVPRAIVPAVARARTARPELRRKSEPPIAADVPTTAITLPAPAPAALAEAASVPASAPRLVLDAEATRLAIRDVARHPSPAAQAHAADPEPGANERLAQGVAVAQKGDCMKAEYLGAGAGLLSIPFLIAAEAMGKCSSK